MWLVKPHVVSQIACVEFGDEHLVWSDDCSDKQHFLIWHNELNVAQQRIYDSL